jgi:hypothetical protein
MFSGPSKDVVLQMARGVASVTIQIKMLDALDPAQRRAAETQMRRDGAPTSIPELSRMAASVVRQHNLGFIRKNQYLGAIEAYLVQMGMTHSDARFIKGQVELLAS